MEKTILIAASMISLGVVVSSCSRPADVASQNLSNAADNFEIARRVIFINGITDKYLLSIEGLCSLGNNDGPKEVTVTCKTADGKYVKNFLGLSDNVTYMVEQLSPEKVSTYQYSVAFRPATILPDFKPDLGQGYQVTQ